MNVKIGREAGRPVMTMNSGESILEDVELSLESEKWVVQPRH